MKENNPVFRKAVIGGFNRQDVIEYIEKTKNEFFEYKKDTDKIIGELYEKINNLNTLLEAANSAKEAECKQIAGENEANEKDTLSFSEISKVALELKTAAEMICGNFESLFKRMGINEPVLCSETEASDLQSAVENEEEVIVEEEQEDKKSSFFDDLLCNVCPKNENRTKTGSVSSVSQFDDLLKI